MRMLWSLHVRERVRVRLQDYMRVFFFFNGKMKPGQLDYNVNKAGNSSKAYPLLPVIRPSNSDILYENNDNIIIFIHNIFKSIHNIWVIINKIIHFLL